MRFTSSLLFIFCLACSDMVEAQPLSSSQYDSLRSEFLNIDNSHINVVDLNSYYGDSSQDFPEMAGGQNVFEGKSNEGGYLGWYTFGGTHWCRNSLFNTWSICRLMTGGSPGNNQTVCGSTVNNDYATAVSCTECHCSPGEWAQSSGTRLWVGAGSNSTFIMPLVGGSLANGPANRLCIEFELDPSRMRFLELSDSREYGDIGKAQLVNPDMAHDNLDWLRFEVGTYTSVYHSESSTSDEETGGSYQGGGSHYYHKPASYGRYPMDRAYAVSQNTFVACIGPAPSGVRSGMRPPYSYNPLYTVVGENSEGLTDAYSYIPYLARLYFDIHGSGTEVQYPVEVKFNKIISLYEDNDVFAMSKRGSVLGVDIVSSGQVATFPFTVYNNADEDRTYRIMMMCGGNLAFDRPAESFKVYVDDNGNGVKDAHETTELIPAGTITLSANTDLHLVALTNPHLSTWDLVGTERYGRQFMHSGITLQEVGRMRMASYAMRTFIGTTDDVANKETLLAGMQYPSPDSDYATYAAWNHQKANNMRLVRNTPDFQMAHAKLSASNTPKAPTNLRIR